MHPTNRIHFVGTSAVLTIDPSHVKRLGIDDFTFFEEKPIENGIVLQMRKLEPPQEPSGSGSTQGLASHTTAGTDCFNQEGHLSG